MGKEMDFVANQLLAQSEKNVAMHKVANKLKTAVESYEEEVTDLKSTVQRLQARRPVYVPAREDPIDLALADFINTRNLPLDVHFEREDHGIYVFGTKRVFIKLEQGRIISNFLYSSCGWRLHANKRIY